MIVRTELEPSRRTAHLAGRFDAHEAPGFRSVVHPLVTAENPVILMNLSQVAFLDSTALAELVRLQKQARSLGGEVVLVDPADAVRVILEITAIAEVFTIRSSGDGPS
ncbi:STAS domain-containing protein [Microbacterium sp. NPDC090007]|uniref:STAS domain-containing protein n=1 Tax=Microbacterium sp. NPDC090007 TaxID=3364204 RepID=UPI0038195B96